MSGFTERQKQIAELLLCGCDSRGVRQRAGITEAQREDEYAAMRAVMGVESHSALVARLRELQRGPNAMIEAARLSPREWWTV